MTDTTPHSSRPSLDSADGIVFGSAIDSDLGISDRTRRDWIAKAILPAPDGNLLGRPFWRVATYRTFKERLFAGQLARTKAPPSYRRGNPIAA